MKEKLMVRGSRHWVADKDAKILLSNHETYRDARAALVAMEKQDRADGIYVARFYTVVEGVLGALRLKGYTAIDDIHACTDI